MPRLLPLLQKDTGCGHGRWEDAITTQWESERGRGGGKSRGWGSGRQVVGTERESGWDTLALAPLAPPLSLAPLLPPDVYFCACSSGCEIGSAPLKADLENGIMGQYTDAKRSLEMVPLHIALDQVTQTHNLWPVRG